MKKELCFSLSATRWSVVKMKYAPIGIVSQLLRELVRCRYDVATTAPVGFSGLFFPMVERGEL
jgi:hypothetical protein